MELEVIHTEELLRLSENDIKSKGLKEIGQPRRFYPERQENQRVIFIREEMIPARAVGYVLKHVKDDSVHIQFYE